MARASLGTIVPSTTSGTTLAALLSARDAAENSGHLGSGRPSYAAEGMTWAESTFDPPHLWLGGAAGDGSEDVDLTLLFAPRPGTTRTTAEVRLPAGWLWADGSAVLRADYPDLLNAIAPLVTGDTHSSTSITNVSEDLRQLGLIGAKIEGTGIPVGATITAIGATTITLSAAATSTNAGVSLRIFPQGNGNASTTFNLPNAKDRVVIGRGDMGGTDVALVTVAGGAGFDGTKLGAVGGSQGVVLLVTNLPVHSHSASTSGTTDTHAGHTHGPGSYNTNNSGTHTHNYVRFSNNVFSGGAGIAPTAQIAGSVDFFQGTVASVAGGNHDHSVNSGVSSTGGSHSHVLTLSTTVGNTGSDTLHSNVQPSAVFNVLVKT